jgi:hypothetical protein
MKKFTEQQSTGHRKIALDLLQAQLYARKIEYLRISTLLPQVESDKTL